MRSERIGMEPSRERTIVIVMSEILVMVLVVVWAMSRCCRRMAESGTNCMDSRKASQES